MNDGFEAWSPAEDMFLAQSPPLRMIDLLLLVRFCQELTEGSVSLAKLRPRIPVPAAYRLAPKKLVLIDLENMFRELGDVDPARRAKEVVGAYRPKNGFTKFARGFNVWVSRRACELDDVPVGSLLSFFINRHSPLRSRTNKIETTKLHDNDATAFLIAARPHFGFYPAEAGQVYLDLERARGHGSKGTPVLDDDGEGDDGEE